jgi:hypothetical protein
LGGTLGGIAPAFQLGHVVNGRWGIKWPTAALRVGGAHTLLDELAIIGGAAGLLQLGLLLGELHR